MIRINSNTPSLAGLGNPTSSPRSSFWTLQQRNTPSVTEPVDWGARVQEAAGARLADFGLVRRPCRSATKRLGAAPRR